MILCAVGKRKREEDSDQSKKDIDIYPLKRRHHTSPERDSESHDISHRDDKEPARGRPYKKKERIDLCTSSSKSFRMPDNERRNITQDGM